MLYDLTAMLRNNIHNQGRKHCLVVLIVVKRKLFHLYSFLTRLQTLNLVILLLMDGLKSNERTKLTSHTDTKLIWI